MGVLHSSSGQQHLELKRGIVETGVRSSHLTHSAAPVGPWTPADLSPEGWWRADLGVTRLIPTLEVTDWANQGSESDLDVDQSTGTKRPDIVDSDANFNGQASVHFDNGDVLTSIVTAAFELAADGDSFALVAVVRKESTTALDTIAASSGVSNGGLTVQVAASATSRCTVEDDSTVSVTAPGPVLSLDTVYVVAGVHTGAASPSLDSTQYWTDGVGGTVATADQNIIRPSSPGTRFWLIGAASNAAGNGLDGHIPEIIYLKRLPTADEDVNLTGYLNTYYGLSLLRVTR